MGPAKDVPPVPLTPRCASILQRCRPPVLHNPSAPRNGRLGFANNELGRRPRHSTRDRQEEQRGASLLRASNELQRASNDADLREGGETSGEGVVADFHDGVLS